MIGIWIGKVLFPEKIYAFDWINVREYRRGNQNGQSRETGNIGYTKQKHNIICVGHHYTQTNTNNVNKDMSSLINKWR